MRKWISLFFILAMCGTLLPAVLSYEEKKVVLFSTVEEEHPEPGKEAKAKEVAKAFLADQAYLATCTSSGTAFPNLAILFSDDPCIGKHTPPPDPFC